jgi:predicted secreted acid phosphatase
MKCPYLEGTYFQWCKASKESYIPSQFEFKEYCTNGGYKVCPGYYKAEYENKNEGAGKREHLVSNGGG